MAPLAQCVPYIPDEESFMYHYCPEVCCSNENTDCLGDDQKKGGTWLPRQRQYGYGGYPVFRGDPYQEGHGIGSLFGSIFRGVAPLLKRAVVPAVKSIAKNVGKSALKHAVGVATDVISGEKDLKSAVQDQAMAGLKDAGNIVKNAVVSGLTSTTNRSGNKRRKSPRAGASKKRKQRGAGDFGFFLD